MLVDVVQVADGDDPLGGDLLVVGLDALRDARLAEFVGRVGPDADQLAPGLCRAAALFPCPALPPRARVIDLLLQCIGERRIADQVPPEPVRHRLAQRGDAVN